MKKVKEDDTNTLTTTIDQFAWEAHNDFCEICLEVGGDFSSSGGRPKRKRKGRPNDEQIFQRRKVMVILTHLNL